MPSQMRRLPAFSPRVLLSYVLDWAVIIIIAIIAATLSLVEPNHRPFSLVDPDISFPYVSHQKISTSVLFVVSLVAPAIIITLVCLIFVRGPAVYSQPSRSQVLRRKLWEWNVGWMGLALGCAVTAFFTNALKLLVGKPRPDLLSRCVPDLTAVTNHVLGGISDQISEGTLVSWTICQQTDRGKLKDGFQSFPSGHSSFTFAGFFYLALFLCSKFGVKLPSLFPRLSARNESFFPASSKPIRTYPGDSTVSGNTLRTMDKSQDGIQALGSKAAAPPTYLLILPLIPICVATYIASTRFSDFRHHGFDILFGAFLGILFSWASFRMYHLPVARGDGLAWGSRSPSRAFGIAVGSSGYVEEVQLDRKSDDIEAGQMDTDMEESISKTSSHQNGRLPQQHA